ncbi:sulfite exporter TauE/SafE family protein [Desulfovibrio psychrotolerans]|uniref:Probable membrane transporter protein n=1 Tax=Desulfovibrio psychrotolerans TaxID=415242 RepID=A0A7J0BZ32_9BACT|nr:sulfite exporter TauE/SafE family protein [Desulfovibrio psychrotolerans]GFM38234.1 UPF0721 transmembrane protein [Desulfovibrio psychrotolerans]
MLFSTAGIEVAIWVPPLVAFCISFFTSMGGVSGAFLLLPFQISFLGYTNPSVSATNQLFNIVATPGGVYRYWKEGRMVWPLAWTVVLGTLPGVFIGAFIRVTYLPDPAAFKLFASAVLLYIGLRMVKSLVSPPAQKNGTTAGAPGIRHADTHCTITDVRFSLSRIGYTYAGERYEVSFRGIALLSFIVGIVGGVYGIGGGAIIAPFLVTFFGLPVHAIAGACLLGTFMTSIAGVAFYQALAPFYPGMSVAPDWLLGILFGLGGLAGMYFGARCQKHVPARAIKWMLAGVILFTAGKYAADFFLS